MFVLLSYWLFLVDFTIALDLCQQHFKFLTLNLIVFIEIIVLFVFCGLIFDKLNHIMFLPQFVYVINEFFMLISFLF